MQDTTTIRETFSDRDGAESARERLEYAGFARNSIDIMRVGDQLELTIHTRPENRQRAEDCINASDIAFAARRYGRQALDAAPAAGQTLLLLGAVAATGAALYWAFSRNREYLEEARRWASDTYEHWQGDDDRQPRGRNRDYNGRFADRSPGLRSDAAGYGA
jgi:hypothetical protein